MSIVDEILPELYRYSAEGLLPVIAPGIEISFERNSSQAFSAAVKLSNGNRYLVSVFDGCAAKLVDAVLSEKGETVTATLDALSAQLFGARQQDNVLQSFILHGAVLFAILHEVSHIICGHFEYQVQHGLAEPVDGLFQIDELDKASSPPRASQGPVDGQWRKLVELEADEIAFDILRSASYEILLAGDEFRNRVASVFDPNKLPQALEFALGEAMLCSAAAVCFLIGAERRQSAGTTYPLPDTRIISLAHLLTMKLVFGEQDGGARERVRVQLTDDLRERLGSMIASTVLNALEFGNACLAAVHGHPRDGTPREVVLTRDVVGILLDDRSRLTTAGAMEFAELQGRFGAFKNGLDEGYRRGFLTNRGGRRS
jgi:hypothetical protein